MDRLKREGNPPAGQLASPVPQYKDTVLNAWAELQGEGGASYVKDRDALAKLEQVRVLLSGVATETKLEEARALLESVAGKDFATQATLAQVKSELELVKAELATIKANQLSGDQKVQLSGTIVWVNLITASTTIPVDTSEVFEVDLPVGRKVGVYLRKGADAPPGGLTVKATAKAMDQGLFVDDRSDSQIIVENHRAGISGLNYPVTKELNFYAPRLRVTVTAVGNDAVVNQLRLWVVI